MDQQQQYPQSGYGQQPGGYAQQPGGYSQQQQTTTSTVYVQQTVPAAVVVTTAPSDNDMRFKALIAYPFTLLSAILIIIIEDRSHYVYFNGWQSLILAFFFIPAWIIAGIIDTFAIPLAFGILLFIVWMIWVFLIVLCMVKAYQGYPNNYFQLPLIGSWAMSQANNKFGGAAATTSV